MKYPIYFDHNATTPCLPEVLDAMLPYFKEHFGNASSIHHPFGWLAEEGVETAREQVAKLIGAAPKEVVFTSGATESINLAIRGIAETNPNREKHFITAETEHKAVLDTFHYLAEKGWSVTYLPVNRDGQIDMKKLEAAIRPETVMMAIMQANNETGVIQPIAEMVALAKKRGVLFFTDGVQAVGKIPVNVRELGVDMMALSAHKFYGPKGVGALYIRKSKPSIQLSPQLTGGGHELGRRSGTLNVPGIVGLGKAAEMANIDLAEESKRLAKLRDYLENELLKIEGCQRNGPISNRLPHVSNLSFDGVEGKAFLIRINKELAISSGSACSSVTEKPSHVLSAMGLDEATAKATLRFGLGKSTTLGQINFAHKFVKEAYGILKNPEIKSRY